MQLTKSRFDFGFLFFTFGTMVLLQPIIVQILAEKTEIKETIFF